MPFRWHCGRKGASMFLHGKFKRLGIPFTVYFWLLGPALWAFLFFVVVRPVTQRQITFQLEMVDAGNSLISLGFRHISRSKQTKRG